MFVVRKVYCVYVPDALIPVNQLDVLMSALSAHWDVLFVPFHIDASDGSAWVLLDQGGHLSETSAMLIASSLGGSLLSGGPVFGLTAVSLS